MVSVTLARGQCFVFLGNTLYYHSASLLRATETETIQEGVT